MFKFNLYFFVTAMLVCALANAGVIINHNLDDDDEDECDCVVPTHILEPQCASDGQTYPNKAAIRCTNQCEVKDIKIVHTGYCSEEDYDIS